MYRTLALGALASSAVFTAAADPVLDMMRSASIEGPVYAYEMNYTGEGVVAAGKVDPSQPEGKRIQIYSPSEDAQSSLKWSRRMPLKLSRTRRQSLMLSRLSRVTMRTRLSAK